MRTGNCAECFDGLSVPTFFVNRIVASFTMGGCIKFYMAAQADGHPMPLPEVCIIWDAASLQRAMATVDTALQAVFPLTLAS